MIREFKHYLCPDEGTVPPPPPPPDDDDNGSIDPKNDGLG